MFDVYCPRCGTGGNTRRIDRVRQPVCKCSNCGLWITVVGDALLDHQVNVRVDHPDAALPPVIKRGGGNYDDRPWPHEWVLDDDRPRARKSVVLGIMIGLVVLWLLLTR